jgi:hypothetical protein
MIATLFIVAGAIVTVGNYFGIVYAKFNRANYSCIPILGGLLGSVGLLATPKLRNVRVAPARD